MDIKTANCLFCKSTKTKVDSKSSGHVSYVNNKSMRRHTVSVRCGSCHARGPTCSILLEDGDRSAITKLEQEAVRLWNDRADTTPCPLTVEQVPRLLAGNPVLILENSVYWDIIEEVTPVSLILKIRGELLLSDYRDKWVASAYIN